MLVLPSLAKIGICRSIGADTGTNVDWWYFVPGDGLDCRLHNLAVVPGQYPMTERRETSCPTCFQSKFSR